METFSDLLLVASTNKPTAHLLFTPVRESHLLRYLFEQLITTSMRRAAFVAVVASIFLPSAAGAQSVSSREESSSLTKDFAVTLRMQYLVVLPGNYTKDGQPWPVILYLHGAGERGTDAASLRRTEAVQQAEARADFPFILVAPQVSDLDQSWLYPQNRAAAIDILDEVVRKYHGDTHREYVTGISMGGWGAWFFAYSFPHRFAAIAPLCGLDADLRWAPQITSTPVWAFHGTNDNVAPIVGTERMIARLQELGADPKFTPVVGGDHDIAKAVYSRKDLYTWLLKHSSDR